MLAGPHEYLYLRFRKTLPREGGGEKVLQGVCVSVCLCRHIPVGPKGQHQVSSSITLCFIF